jgi:hypothetical protein
MTAFAALAACTALTSPPADANAITTVTSQTPVVLCRTLNAHQAVIRCACRIRF